MLGDGTDRHEEMTALEILLPIMLPLLAALVVGYLFRFHSQFTQSPHTATNKKNKRLQPPICRGCN